LSAVTLILATYNDSDRIRACIESILVQSYEDWKLIIVDDHSDDDTLVIIQEYLSNPKITLIKNTRNIGLAASLNKAIKIISTPLIARVDGDDIQLPHRLEFQINLMQKYPAVDLLTCNVFNKYSDGTRVPGTIKSIADQEIKEQLEFRNVICHPTVMIRKTFFEKAGLYDAQLRRSQDWELWLRGKASGCIFLSASEIVTEYWTNDYKRSINVLFQYTTARLKIFVRHQRFSQAPYVCRDVLSAIYRSMKSSLKK